MKALACLAFLVLAQPAAAEIYADFTVDDGTASPKKFTIRLRWEAGYTPRSVANFIGLATGSRKWVDEATGETRIDTPFYTGQTIHRAVHESVGIKFRSGISIGSPSASGIDGPGYLFQDELNGNLNPGSSISNTVYLETASPDLAAKRPNTSGSRLFISSLAHTEPLTNLVPIGVLLQFTPAMFPNPQQTSWLNVWNFAQVPTDPNDQPNNDLTITDVSIRRSGSPSILFNELDPNWGLPEVGASVPTIVRENGVPFLRFSQNPGTSGHYYTSEDLFSWSGPNTVFQAPDDATLGVDLSAALTTSPKLFFRGSAIAYPSTPAADKPLPNASYATIFTSPTLGSRIYTFTFNSTGDGGTWCWVNPNNTDFCLDSGALTLVDFKIESPFTSSLFLSGDNDLPNFFFRFHHDRDTATGQPLTQSRLDGSEWEIIQVAGFDLRVPVANSEFIETANNVWRYFAAP